MELEVIGEEHDQADRAQLMVAGGQRPLQDLHLFRSLHELQDKAYLDEKEDQGSTKPFQTRVGEIYKKALLAYNDGDEEHAYYYFFRYVTAVTADKLIGSDLDSLIWKENIRHAKKAAKSLTESLSLRYVDKEWKENEHYAVMEFFRVKVTVEVEALKILHLERERLLALQKTKKILSEIIQRMTGSRMETCLAQMEESDVPVELRCPICYEIFKSHVILCRNGHSLCSECHSRLSMCPLCQTPFIGTEELIRNLAMESMVDSFKIKALSNNDELYKEKVDKLAKLEAAIQLKEMRVKILENRFREAAMERMEAELRWWILEGHTHNPAVVLKTVSDLQGGMVGVSAILLTFALAANCVYTGKLSIFLHPTPEINGIWLGYQEKRSYTSFAGVLNLFTHLGEIAASKVQRAMMALKDKINQAFISSTGM